ncbi:dockerin type I domain-containing protein [Paenibacillus sp. UNC451MF]|uniref:dockerin type I domain-containing protein n=1 Tax=Paenibacillus sp. UNC451MF TaxID=1449063 RepID=UPI00048CCA06|nr:dockerin type I domain-containing protein [Paenibacillus sp. UNC451MF]
MKGIFNKNLLRLMVAFLVMLQLGVLAAMPTALANTLPASWTATTMNGAMSSSSTAFVSQESVNYSQGVFDIAARRGKMQSTAQGGDTVYFVYVPVEGDFTMTARVVSVGIEPGSSTMNTENRAMLMVKDGVSNDSDSFSVIYRPIAVSPTVTGTVTSYKRFGSSSGTGSSASGTFNAPIYLKLEKAGNIYRGSYSADGMSYTQYYTQTDTANTLSSSSLNVGLAVTAATVQFDNVTITKSSSDFLNAPANLLAHAGDGSVGLSWDTVTGATYYKVKRSTQSGGSFATVAGNVYSSSYTDSNVINGITYYYVITAANDKLESAPSLQASAKPEAASLPVSSISVSSASGNEITVQSGTLQMQAAVLPNNATNRTVSWSVYESDGVTLTDKAAIGSTGLLQAVKDGTVKVVARALDGSNVQGSAVVTISGQTPSINRSVLQSAITDAQTAYNDSLEGTDAGQYPKGAKALLLSAISAAQAVLEDVQATQEQIDRLSNDLIQALQTFHDSVLSPKNGDVDGNGVIDIGDLGIVSGVYGSTTGSADWNSAKRADMNQDNTIDWLDIDYVAQRIP